MTGEPFATIEFIDLSQVRGGVDKQTRAAQLAIAQATGAVKDIAGAVAPNDNTMAQVMLQMLGGRRPGPGPTPAPALPPTSTLTR